ncbi:MAG: hypothetical protein WCJ64_26265 [Rhodospirillaceae bacterium]
MSTELSLNEQMAYPFLEMAVRVDTAIQNRGDNANLASIMSDNVVLWIFFKNLINNSTQNASEGVASHISEISEFMTKASKFITYEADTELMGRLVALNLNMSEMLLKSSALPEVPSFQGGE